MRVKICGLKSFFDADLALSLGATELGFIFTESARRIDPEVAKAIVEQLPKSSKTIGVFKDASLDHVLQATDFVGLSGVQLHGHESVREIHEFKKLRPSTFVFKTIGVREEDFTLDPVDYEMCDALLFDSSIPHSEQDKRKPIQSQRLKSMKLNIPFFVAGSINPTNVNDLIRSYSPDGIDVSSGIEAGPGLKDPKLMQKLFSKLKGNL